MNAQEQKILDQIVYELKDPKDADNLCKKGYGYLFFEKGEGVWKGQNLLHFYKDNADMIDWLIQHGLNVNEADANGRTPLFCSLQQ